MSYVQLWTKWLLSRLGATSIEKSLKISASGRNFLHPSPPYSKKGHTDKNVGILYLIVIVKFGFFKISHPPSPILEKSQTSPILLIEVAPDVKVCLYVQLDRQKERQKEGHTDRRNTDRRGGLIVPTLFSDGCFSLKLKC